MIKVDLFPLVFVFPTLFLIGFLVVKVVRSPLKKLIEENGNTPIFEEICGGRFNMMNYTWPLVRHSIYDDFVVIKYVGGGFLIPRQGLIVESSDSLVSTGVRYRSEKYKYHEIRVWTLNKSDVMSLHGGT